MNIPWILYSLNMLHKNQIFFFKWIFIGLSETANLMVCSMIEDPIADRIGLRFCEAVVDGADKFIACIGNGVDLSLGGSVTRVSDTVVIPGHIRVVVIASQVEGDIVSHLGLREISPGRHGDSW